MVDQQGPIGQLRGCVAVALGRGEPVSRKIEPLAASAIPINFSLKLDARSVNVAG